MSHKRDKQNLPQGLSSLSCRIQIPQAAYSKIFFPLLPWAAHLAKK